MSITRAIEEARKKDEKHHMGLNQIEETVQGINNDLLNIIHQCDKDGNT